MLQLCHVAAPWAAERGCCARMSTRVPICCTSSKDQVEGRASIHISVIACRVVNVYLISTVGVGDGIGSHDTDRCLQCPCDDNPDKGGYACCKDCPSKTPGPPRSYWFEYKVSSPPLVKLDIRPSEQGWGILSLRTPASCPSLQEVTCVVDDPM